MRFGICLLSCVPVRKSPEFWGELASELLFGEHFEVLDSQGVFAKVRMAYDSYEGWIDLRQTVSIGLDEFQCLNEAVPAVSLDAITFTQIDDHKVMVLRGSSLPFYSNGEFCVGGRRFSFLGKVRKPDSRITSKELADFALSYLNSPYRWGGRTPFGIDCASFVQVVFKAFGVYLSRETYNQKEEGKEIGSITDAQVGDLAFFRSISKDLPHVGIVLGDEIIHACGTVRIDSIDKTGIFNRKIKKYTYRFTGIRRVANYD